MYDPAFAHIARGWIPLRELVLAAPELGITRIDLGRGDDEYKRRAKTGETLVAHGLVTRSSIRRTLRTARLRPWQGPNPPRSAPDCATWCAGFGR